MKKRPLLLSGVLVALSASAALAAGTNLSYDDCGTFGLANRTFACNTNLGTNTMVASYVAPALVTQFVSVESELELQSDGATLPAWWEYKNTGTCRTTALTLSGDFTAGPFSCTDFWQGAAAGGIGAYTIGYGGANRAYIKLVLAVGSANAGPLNLDEEYYAYKLSFSNANTVGTGSCAGCLTPVCIVLRNIKLVQSSALNDNRLLSYPVDRNYVRWQSAGDYLCFQGDPARRSTWGGVKALYR